MDIVIWNEDGDADDYGSNKKIKQRSNYKNRNITNAKNNSNTIEWNITEDIQDERKWKSF